MSPISVTELENLHEEFSQISMRTGTSTHYIDRRDGYYELAGHYGGRRDGTTNVTETTAFIYLVPARASMLLGVTPGFDNIPETMEAEKTLRRNAHEVALQINELDDPETIPILRLFVSGLDLDHLNQRDIVADAIVEKVAILSVYKIIQLMGKNGGSVDYDLPEQVKNYMEAVGEVKEVLRQLDELAEANEVLNFPMQDVVRADEKWVDQDEMERVVKKQKETGLGARIFNLIAGSENRLRRAIQYSQLWAREGLDDENIYRLTQEQINVFLRIGARYFSWYSMLDDKWTGVMESNYEEDFMALKSTFTDKKDPGYVGDIVATDVHKAVLNDLEVAEKVLFVEE